MELIPGAFMDVIEKCAVCVGDHHDPKRHIDLSGDRVDEDRVNGNTENAIAYCFDDRAPTVFMV